MSRQCVAITVIAVAFLSSPAWGQETKVLGKTQEEWLKILEEHKEIRFRKAAVLVLGSKFPRTRETMAAFTRAMANDTEPDIRIEIAATVGGFGKEGASMVDALAQRLEQDNNARVREAAARSLGKLAEFAAVHVERLGKALKDPDANTSAVAAEALVLFGASVKKIQPQLTEAASDPKRGVFTRIYAVRILAKQFGKDEKTAEVLADILADKTTPMNLRQTAVTALDGMGQSALVAASILARILENDRRDEKDDKDQFLELRRTAGVALGKIGPAAADDAVPAVLKVLKDPDIALRAQAVRLSGILGQNNEAITKQLVLLLKEEKNAEVLVAVIQESAELGIQSAQPQLTALMQDSRAAVRDAAGLSLKKLKAAK